MNYPWEREIPDMTYWSDVHVRGSTDRLHVRRLTLFLFSLRVCFLMALRKNSTVVDLAVIVQLTRKPYRYTS